MELELEDEFGKSGSSILKLTITYKPDGNYLIEVLIYLCCVQEYGFVG